MLIFSSKCVKLVVVILFFRISTIQVESAFASSAKIQRTHSIRIPKPPPQPSTSWHHDLKPIAEEHRRLSGSIEVSETGTHHEQREEQQPLVERESKNVPVSSSINLLDPNAVTYGELNPRRDGAFARMRNRALRFGSTAITASAIGAAGGLTAKELLFQPKIRTTSTTQKYSNDSDSVPI